MERKLKQSRDGQAREEKGRQEVAPPLRGVRSRCLAMKCRVRLLSKGVLCLADQSSVRRRRRQRAEKVTYVRRFFALCCGELAGFSAPRDAGAGAGVGTTLPNS